MLVLTRKNDESIIIDDKIKVKVVGIEGNQVKLGIEAPREIKIHRKEVYEQIEAENKEAAKTEVKSLKDIVDLVEKQRKISEEG